MDFLLAEADDSVVGAVGEGQFLVVSLAVIEHGCNDAIVAVEQVHVVLGDVDVGRKLVDGRELARRLVEPADLVGHNRIGRTRFDERVLPSEVHEARVGDVGRDDGVERSELIARQGTFVAVVADGRDAVDAGGVLAADVVEKLAIRVGDGSRDHAVALNLHLADVLGLLGRRLPVDLVQVGGWIHAGAVDLDVVADDEGARGRATKIKDLTRVDTWLNHINRAGCCTS